LATSCVIIRRTCCTDNNFLVIDNIAKGLRSHYISASPHAAEAPHAEVVIPYEKRLVFFAVQVLRHVASEIFLDSDILSHLSKLTNIKQRTTALILWNIGRTLSQAAAFLLSTGQAGVRMLRKQGCQILLPEDIELRRGCHNIHSLLCLSYTREDRIRVILNFNQTKTTALVFFAMRIRMKLFRSLITHINRRYILKRRQIWMITEMRNINSSSKGSL
jgi:hypothetical protein